MPLFCSTDLNKTGKTYWDKVELYYNSLLLIFLSESFPRCPCLDSLAAARAETAGGGRGQHIKRNGDSMAAKQFRRSKLRRRAAQSGARRQQMPYKALLAYTAISCLHVAFGQVCLACIA